METFYITNYHNMKNNSQHFISLDKSHFKYDVKIRYDVRNLYWQIKITRNRIKYIQIDVNIHIFSSSNN